MPPTPTPAAAPTPAPGRTGTRALTRARWGVAAVLLSALLVLGGAAATGPGAGPAAADDGGRGGAWVGTWATVPTATPPTATPVLHDETVRQVVHTSVGGDRLRLRLTNEFGDAPLRIGEVRVARRAGDAGTDIVPATDRAVTFSGQTAVTVPAGAPLVSDPVKFDLPPRADLVVSVYLPEETPVTTLHAFSYQENEVAQGNATRAASVEATETMTQWHLLSGISVRTRGHGAGAVVALGDSITDGAETRVNANNRWPDLLAERLRHTGVLNLGVAGNRLLHDPNPPEGGDAENYAAFFGESALRRFDRDVLAQPGAEHVIVLLGVNDLGHPGTTAPESETVSAEQIIGAHRQIIARAHAAGLRVYGGTILPFKGDTLGFHSAENEAKRQRVNDWIRGSGEYDAVIDFDRVMRDPADPLRLRPAYDSGDHLHPNDAGMAAMAEAVPASLFRPDRGR
ncbi:SGNH/GDSL hydrolase family protein [Streptomonospora nanhaiensis]|uniref:Lysophospholipase L1-like esterase n=1 Tax=Streptomonospora nanhaiensis TaxID=1323731 RepID=A0A853BJM1_9ACTN|nr:SGNH/GDSL hydrolase family protein [Streptomonospora nanhaiensis]MBV2365853.1 SGNH/GDSL hydrolase family protein [Streptomonospora nanhaiensis]MBX9387586.1 SGNH/GDSL hydrolase family protein [Streptomonospora nanhaiensis]NYI95230.1 lysophospholipase L1-like esterase [Streptomonospora nanhaiensis]